MEKMTSHGILRLAECIAGYMPVYLSFIEDTENPRKNKVFLRGCNLRVMTAGPWVAGTSAGHALRAVAGLLQPVQTAAGDGSGPEGGQLDGI
ncbi:hypothetical protein [Cereibacter sphaeroides]|uniref:hypothetical protein n=1 Tax=Cereibacter sphaeroides TaxID=1063 RepID=UPI001F175890|nr:hypothetical protein [Cereibacter sphaeroides]MCE6967447.1 hypothetical protein [Cereibacter sphaeroides]